MLLVLSYIVTGKLALILALPPGYASPIFPPAGIAIAALLIGGPRLLPGVLLGAFALNVIPTAHTAATPLTPFIAVIAALMVAIGSTLQAWVGGTVLRRCVKPGLDSGRDIVLFLAIVPVVCLVSASVAISSLYLLHILPSHALLSNWIIWWAGDTIGTLLTAPLVWVYIGSPRRLWWRRRWLLIVPMCVSSAVFITAYVKASGWERDQLTQTFRLKSQQVGDALQYQFDEHERLLQVLATVLKQKNELTEAEFSTIARGYLDHRPDIRLISWAPRVTMEERSEFEQWARRNVAKDFVIKERGTKRDWIPHALRSQYFPVLYVVPKIHNERVIGYDKLSRPTGGQTLLEAIKSGKPTASEMVALIQLEGSKKAIILAQAIPLAPAAHKRPGLGIVSMVLQLDPYLERALSSTNFPNFLARLEDISRNGAPTVMADNIHRAPQAGDYQRVLQLGGRQYRLTLAPTTAYLASTQGWQSWAALIGGFFLAGLLGAFLLLLSGQRAQIESVVADRTRKLHDREVRLNAILDNAADAILTIDRAGKLISVNGMAGKLFGYAEHAMIGMLFDKLVKLADGESGVQLLERLGKQSRPSSELTGCRPDGQLFPLAMSVSQVRESDEPFFVCVLRDLSEQYRSREQIYELAHHDPLTGLANRFTLNQRLEHLLALSRRGQAAVAVMFIDLDHFKKINDSMGHQIGDKLLMAASSRLKKLLGEDDIVARPGGDEFVVVLAHHESVDSVSLLANRIIADLSETYRFGDHKLHSGASIGISLYPSDGMDVDTLLRNADAAMYVAKGKGRGNYQFFSSELDAVAHERLQIENQIWQGLERNEFELFLQPQMHLASRKIIGAEALIRWKHSELGLIAPDRFIPIAEESGLIIPLGEWVLERAFQILSGWQKGQFAELRLAINLSARQCHSGTLINAIDKLQQTTGVDLRWLEMEITETAAMQDPEQTRELLHQLRSRGIKVAIDDFGTGYSSLSYLKIFAIDRIKIDRSFVKDIEKDQNDALIASATIGLAHNLGLDVIAEGVETEAQCAFLNHELCDEGQGYLFGKPMPLTDFESLVEANQTDIFSMRAVASI
jgi:diguanylate cyclase (GGDEF)-like protein/PAS domain S-box-containing protein